jgi:hypothetical protein
MITMVFAGIQRQASRVEKGKFVMGVVMEFFNAKFKLGAGFVCRSCWSKN